MTVCYDLSAAATAAVNPDGGMTGVPRVVEHLLQELQRAPIGELRLCAPSDPLAGWRYYQQNLAASGTRFLHGRMETPPVGHWRRSANGPSPAARTVASRTGELVSCSGDWRGRCSGGWNGRD